MAPKGPARAPRSLCRRDGGCGAGRRRLQQRGARERMGPPVSATSPQRRAGARPPQRRGRPPRCDGGRGKAPAMQIVMLSRRQDGVVTWQQARDAGYSQSSVRSLLASGEWRRVRRGAYLVDPGRSLSHPLVQCRAVVLTTPNAVIAGASATQLWGLRSQRPAVPEVVVPPRGTLRAKPDLRPHQWRLAADDVTSIRGIPVTTPARSVLDAVRFAGRLDGLALLDESLRRGVLTRSQLLGLRDVARGLPGSVGVEDIWVEADGRAESSLESKVRLRCVDDGLRPDHLQLEIRDARGVLIARVDMAFLVPGSRVLVVVEADGVGPHSMPEVLAHDRVRGNGLTALGHRLVRFTTVDTIEPATIPSAVRRALVLPLAA
ncbi:type IV toxin-antitoxin system AbiEi family antitoxin domain-containing protein [Aquipuribacter nitratireducens]|uniref:Type IV toxin-antitoxin system AbiEi family antitoxin domain-containing protein n=2 Tax=Aquipuribacter nitratireducens TaxID=650104 RepID=A0ABW0GS08_9MICO